VALTPAQQVWHERLARRHHAQILLDPVVRQLGHELAVAAAAEPREQAAERMAPIEDRLGEHLGIGPRPR
jgi:hypothetical protein